MKGKKGMEAIMKIFIGLVITIATGLVLYVLAGGGQAEKILDFADTEGDLGCSMDICSRSPKIHIDFTINDDNQIVIDASSTEACISELVEFTWKINGEDYTVGDEICEDEEYCSQISCCELPDGYYYMNEDVTLTAFGNCSLRESRKVINVGEDSGLNG